MLKSFAEAAGLVPLHLAIGMFDGVHRGHQQVLAVPRRRAQRDGGQAAALTFWPHPSVLFRPDEPTRLIQPPEIKYRRLLSEGLDAVVEVPFDEGFAGIEAADFARYLKAALPGLASLTVGENFRYGKGRRGTGAQLVETGRAAGLEVDTVPRLMLDGSPVSSSRIRDLLHGGEVAQANLLLGYDYFAEGRIVPGRRLGRTIGYPTLNLQWLPELKPRYGVYAVRIQPSEDSPPETWLTAVANYGVRPTVEHTVSPLLEVHALEQVPALDAGDWMRVHWLGFLRGEQRFESIDALRTQLDQDRQNAEAFFQSA